MLFYAHKKHLSESRLFNVFMLFMLFVCVKFSRKKKKKEKKFEVTPDNLIYYTTE